MVRHQVPESLGMSTVPAAVCRVAAPVGEFNLAALELPG
jgi:hypothetical protein